MTRLRGLIARIRSRFDPEGIPFVVGGSFALAARGVIRMTQDIDLMVMTPGLDAVHRAMRAGGFEWINEVIFRDDETGLLVDILPVFDAAQRHVFDAASLTRIEGGPELRVLTAEGCCIMLLREATLGDPRRRPLRLRDIEALALVAPLDWSEIREWAERGGYQDAYDRVDAAGKLAR